MWTVLAFTVDDIVGAGQDARLAEACVRAWTRCGSPTGFQVLQAAGDGTHLVRWYVCDRAARLLDAEGVHWREFRVGECAAPPHDATPVLKVARLLSPP